MAGLLMLLLFNAIQNSKLNDVPQRSDSSNIKELN